MRQSVQIKSLNTLLEFGSKKCIQKQLYINDFVEITLLKFMIYETLIILTSQLYVVILTYKYDI